MYLCMKQGLYVRIIYSFNLNRAYVLASFVYRYTQANTNQQNEDNLIYAVSNVSLTEVNM